MENNTEAKIKRDLLIETQTLKNNYDVLVSFISGKNYEPTTIGNSIQAFKDSLSRASAYVLALYNLKGRRVSIPWEQLFVNIDYALATITVSPSIKNVEAVRVILAMSKDQMTQTISYFSALKGSLEN